MEQSEFNEMIEFLQSTLISKSTQKVLPTKEVIKNSEDLLLSLKESDLNGVDIEINATPNGTIVIDFEIGEKIFSVEVGKTKISYYLSRKDKYLEFDDLPTHDHRTIPYIKKFILFFFNIDSKKQKQCQ
jgi:hypothetical protein